MNIENMVREYAWIEFTPTGLSHNTVEYRIYINWLDGLLYAKHVILTNVQRYTMDTFADMEMAIAIDDFIKHLEKV